MIFSCDHNHGLIKVKLTRAESLGFNSWIFLNFLLLYFLCRLEFVMCSKYLSRIIFQRNWLVMTSHYFSLWDSFSSRKVLTLMISSRTKHVISLYVVFVLRFKWQNPAVLYIKWLQIEAQSVELLYVKSPTDHLKMFLWSK